MKATAVVILVPAVLFLVAPAGAASPKGAAELGKELAALTEAVSAQLKLLEIYEEMGKAEEVKATKETLLGLLEGQRKVIGELREALGGEPLAEIELGFGETTTKRRDPFGPKDAEPVEPPKDVGGVIDRGLAWLAYHQHDDGYWDADAWMATDGLGKEAGAGYVLFDPGVTGLALLAFMGNGHTHRSGKHKKTVLKGMRYLKQIQDPEGCFGPRTSQRFVYNHAICSLAMIESYALTGSPLFKQSSQLAVDFILKAQNPYLGWRYGVRSQDNDTSVTGWMVAALFAAKRAGLRVDEETFKGAMAWIDKMTEPEFGRVGYTTRGKGPARKENVVERFPPDKSESLTAAGIAIRCYSGLDPKKDELIRKGVDLCLMKPPVWNEKDGSIDMYYWYWGTLSMGLVGGDADRVWTKAVRETVRAGQRADGCARGSWDPAGAWGVEGGRVYSTAIMALISGMLDRREAKPPK